MTKNKLNSIFTKYYHLQDSWASFATRSSMQILEFRVKLRTNVALGYLQHVRWIFYFIGFPLSLPKSPRSTKFYLDNLELQETRFHVSYELYMRFGIIIVIWRYKIVNYELNQWKQIHGNAILSTPNV